MTDRLPTFEDLRPPESWPKKAKDAVLPTQVQETGSETPWDPNTWDPKLIEANIIRNNEIGKLKVGLHLPEAGLPKAIDDAIAAMSTDEILKYNEETARYMLKIAVRDLLETHSPIPAEHLALMREAPDEIISMLFADSLKLQLIAKAVKMGVYDEIFAEGIEVHSRCSNPDHKGHGVTAQEERVVAPSDPFSTDAHSEAVSMMQKAFTPFNGPTISLHDLMAQLDDDDNVN